MEGERRHDHPLTEEEKASNYAHFLRQGPTSTSITGDSSSSSSLTAGKMKRTDSEIQEEKSLQQMLLVKPGEEHLHKHTVNPDDVGLMLGDEENEENATEMKMLLDELGLEGVDLEGFMQHHGDVDEEHHDYISGQQGEEDEAGIRSVSAQEVIDTTVPHDSHASSGVTMGSEYYGTNHYSSLGSDTVSDFLKNRSGFIDDNDIRTTEDMLLSLQGESGAARERQQGTSTGQPGRGTGAAGLDDTLRAALAEAPRSKGGYKSRPKEGSRVTFSTRVEELTFARGEGEVQEAHPDPTLHPHEFVSDSISE
ncbi:hypothetical protein ADUPG1_007867 [Aduncisulcus paluster]|uniref:Uncharacterized protein n=1 Tax=Aduncisulcus paluster TaxID=2918883 RepID=A0ABQ5KPV3_9EUKA|nr:hypothetical protein ADUPG1_007867 [Aduncisulcus paluster]